MDESNKNETPSDWERQIEEMLKIQTGSNRTETPSEARQFDEVAKALDKDLRVWWENLDVETKQMYIAEAERKAREEKRMIAATKELKVEKVKSAGRKESSSLVGNLLMIIFYGSIFIATLAPNGSLRTVCIAISVVGMAIGGISYFMGGSGSGGKGPFSDHVN